MPPNLLFDRSITARDVALQIAVENSPVEIKGALVKLWFVIISFALKKLHKEENKNE